MPIAKFDALVRRDPGVALDHRPLDFNGAVHCVDDAAEFDDAAVARALDDATVMHRDGRVDQVAAKGPKAGEDSILIRTRKPRVADDVGHQDRREFPGLAHGASAEARSPVAGGLGMAALPCCTEEDVEAGVQPRVSTGRSIHAVPSITPSPRGGRLTPSDAASALKTVDRGRAAAALGMSEERAQLSPRGFAERLGLPSVTAKAGPERTIRRGDAK